MITDRLYYDDAYLTEFDAHVICVRADEFAVVRQLTRQRLVGLQAVRAALGAGSAADAVFDALHLLLPLRKTLQI